MIKLSILIPTVPNRVSTFFPRIISFIQDQINKSGRKDIELLGLYDNKLLTTGEKRNKLLDIARGNFLVYIDDDDMVSSDYIDTVMKYIDENPDADCFVYDSITSIYGIKVHCMYGIEFSYPPTPESVWRRTKEWKGKPAHTMIYKREIACSSRFPDKQYGEDFIWVNSVCGLIKKQIRINKVLYYYDCECRISESAC